MVLRVSKVTATVDVLIVYFLKLLRNSYIRNILHWEVLKDGLDAGGLASSEGCQRLASLRK